MKRLICILALTTLAQGIWTDCKTKFDLSTGKVYETTPKAGSMCDLPGIGKGAISDSGRKFSGSNDHSLLAVLIPTTLYTDDKACILIQDF